MEIDRNNHRRRDLVLLCILLQLMVSSFTLAYRPGDIVSMSKSGQYHGVSGKWQLYTSIFISICQRDYFWTSLLFVSYDLLSIGNFADENILARRYRQALPNIRCQSRGFFFCWICDVLYFFVYLPKYTICGRLWSRSPSLQDTRVLILIRCKLFLNCARFCKLIL